MRFQPVDRPIRFQDAVFQNAFLSGRNRLLYGVANPADVIRMDSRKIIGKRSTGGTLLRRYREHRREAGIRIHDTRLKVGIKGPDHAGRLQRVGEPFFRFRERSVGKTRCVVSSTMHRTPSMRPVSSEIGEYEMLK